MFRRLFRPDSPLMIVMTQITDCIFLSMFFFMGCLPVVTIGASFAALYDSTYRGFRKGERHTWQRFLSVFKSNLKSGIVPTLVFLAACAGLTKGLVFLWNSAVYEQISWMVFSGGAFVGVLLVGMLSLLFPMLSRFDNSLVALLRNTVMLGIANMPRTLALGILNAAVVFLSARYVVPIFFAPSLAALIGSLFIEPIFKPYMPEEPENEYGEDAAE